MGAKKMSVKMLLTLLWMAGAVQAYDGDQSCAVPSGESCDKAERQAVSGDDDLKIPELGYKPIIGTRNNDAKLVVDQGVVLKVYIATYKDSKKMLVAAHDRYVMAKEPSFIVGSDRPDPRRRTGMMGPSGMPPFIFADGEIDTGSIESNEKITQYLQGVAEANKRETTALENLEEGEVRFDSEIKKYLENVKR